MADDPIALRRLADRLERVGGPSVDMDGDIALATGWRVVRDGPREAWMEPGQSPIVPGRRQPLRYTASADAALLLMPPGLDWRLESLGQAFVHLEYARAAGDAETRPARALAAACLRAHAARLERAALQEREVAHA